jgi:hypothetical protein
MDALRSHLSAPLLCAQASPALHVGSAGQPANARDDEDTLDDDFDLPLTDDADDTDEEIDPNGEFEDLVTPLDHHDGEDPLDDATAEDLETGIELDPLDGEETGLDEDKLDVGPLDEGMHFDDTAASDDRIEARDDDHDDLDLDESTSEDDGGAEGTSDAPEPDDEVDEAALPDLDADDEGDEGDEDLAEALLAGLPAANIPWDKAPWAPLEGAGAAVPCSAVSVWSGSVVAAGEVLLIVDEGARAARRAAPFAGAAAVALTEGILLAATARGQLLFSSDGGTETSTLAGLRAGPSPVALVATPGRVWIGCDGALLCFSSPHKPLSPVRDHGVIGITVSGAVVLALTRDKTGPAIERIRGDDEGWQRTPIGGSARRLVERAKTPICLAAAGSGRCIALANGARVALSRDGGQSFETTNLGPVLALAFAGDEDKAPLLALAAPHDGLDATLIQVPERGELTRIATVPNLPESAAAMAWDTSRDCIWIACGTGLIAIGGARRH